MVATPATDRFWSVVRYHLWRALANDDPVALSVSLTKTCRHERIPIGVLLPLLERRIWRPAGVPSGDGETHRRCLLAAAAGSRRGVPPNGALRCVRFLLQLPHTTADIDAAIGLCARDPETRSEAIRILWFARTAAAVAERSAHRRAPGAVRRPTAHRLADALRKL